MAIEFSTYIDAFKSTAPFLQWLTGMTSYPQYSLHGMAGGGYISPQYLDIRSGELAMAQDDGTPFGKVRLSMAEVAYHIYKFDQADTGIKLRDVGTLQPGNEFQLSQDLIPTPQSILDGSYGVALERSQRCPDVVVVVPRLPRFCGTPSLPSIIFSVNGQAGPYISDLVFNKVAVDNPSDPVFQERVWKQTSLTIDVGHFIPYLGSS